MTISQHYLVTRSKVLWNKPIQLRDDYNISKKPVWPTRVKYIKYVY